MRGHPDYPVYRCNHCTLVFLEPPGRDLREYYRTDYRKEHDHTPGKVSTVEERFAFQQRFSQKSAKNFREHVPAGASVLEIGCSAGGFLSHLQGDYDLFGCEWNPEDARYVRETGEVPCEEGLLPDIFPGRKFTAIVAISVLEHQADPLEFIRQCRDRLIGGGYLYLEVPNLRDALLSFYDLASYADFYFRLPHITYWTGEPLASLLATMGFETRLSLLQRYGLANHLHWLLDGTPMLNPYQAREHFRPVPNAHAIGPVLNRLWSRLDEDYRLQMLNLFGADTLVAASRRQEI